MYNFLIYSLSPIYEYMTPSIIQLSRFADIKGHGKYIYLTYFSHNQGKNIDI